MTYLILDSNIWIYLANSYNPSSKNFEDGFHFKLVSILNKLVDDGDVTILTNEIIIKEWSRNKESAKDLISRYQRRLEGGKEQMKSIKKYLDKKDSIKLDGILDKYSLRINQIIENNKKHIAEVVTLLLSKAEKIEILDTTKITATDRAIEKLAPFKGDKSNSMADAVILLSSIEYLRKISKQPNWAGDEDEGLYFFKNSIFVSGNKKDFANPKNEKEVHPELKVLLDSVEMGYESNLGSAINQVKADLLAKKELEQISKEMEEEYWANVTFCEMCSLSEYNLSPSIVYFSGPISIENELSEIISLENPNQIKLFKVDETEENNEEIHKSNIHSIEIGACDYCGTEYIQCTYCGNVTNISEGMEDDKIECEGCGMIYKFIYNYMGSGMYDYEVKIISDSEEE